MSHELFLTAMDISAFFFANNSEIINPIEIEMVVVTNNILNATELCT